MLAFLVTSKARRRLLTLLWGERAEGSAAQLAREAGVGFASAYRELRAMRRAGLAVSTRSGGVEVYRANRAHPDADLLERLVATTTRSPRAPGESAELRRQLRALGAPLLVEGAVPVPAAPEEVLVAGLTLARHDPAVARAMPVCLWRNRERLDPARLATLARHAGERQTLGFFLDLTSALSGDRRFSGWARGLRDRRVTAVHDFFELPSVTSAAKRSTAPPAARRWGFRMAMDTESFTSLFRKFSDAPVSA